MTAATAIASGSRSCRPGRLRLFALALPLALAPLLAGCADRAGDWCDQQCSCEGCSQHDYDKCKIDVNEQLDTANAYGCSDQADATYNCVMDRAHCDNHHLVWDDVCAPEWQDVGFCIAANSTII